MQIHLSDKLEKARSKAKQIGNFLKKLKGKNSRKLDDLVQSAHAAVFAEINCLDCANCCKTTGPLFTPADIQRISRIFKMSRQEFADTYLKIDEDHDYVLQELPCTFLLEDNRCLIYEHRPKACRQYPHTDMVNQRRLLHLHQKNVLICPAVGDLLERIEEALNEK